MCLGEVLQVLVYIAMAGLTKTTFHFSDSYFIFLSDCEDNCSSLPTKLTIAERELDFA